MEINSTNAMCLWENENTRASFHDELYSFFQRTISENKNFSREYIFQKVQSNATKITFYPTSTSYEKNGPYIIAIDTVKDEKLELNLLNKCDTYGMVKLIANSSEDMSKSEIVIDTKDIYEIEWCN